MTEKQYNQMTEFLIRSIQNKERADRSLKNMAK